MIPADFARLHPRLFHLTRPEAVPSILRHGLLTPLQLLERQEADADVRAVVLARRAATVTLTHPNLGTVWITDNAPLNDQKLAAVLDDGLTPDDWRRMLAERVFLWPNEEHARDLARARLYRSEPRALLILDTLSLTTAHAARVSVSPINSGQTLYKPARRGYGTFAALDKLDWATWRRQRGLTQLDRVKEVTVTDGIPDIADHLLSCDILPATEPIWA